MVEHNHTKPIVNQMLTGQLIIRQAYYFFQLKKLQYRLNERIIVEIHLINCQLCRDYGKWVLPVERQVRRWFCLCKYGMSFNNAHCYAFFLLIKVSLQSMSMYVSNSLFLRTRLWYVIRPDRWALCNNGICI